MATLLDEAMESYAYPSYNPYSYRYQPPKSKGGQGAWRHYQHHQHHQQPHHQHHRSSSGGYFSGYSEAVAAAAAAEYFDNYQRAQLKAILSQVNPNLTPRLRKANTKEVGVQVNPRQDASVQCSLGPRPLLFRSRPAEEEEEEEAAASSKNKAARLAAASPRGTCASPGPSPSTRRWPPDASPPSWKKPKAGSFRLRRPSPRPRASRGKSGKPPPPPGAKPRRATSSPRSGRKRPRSPTGRAVRRRSLKQPAARPKRRRRRRRRKKSGKAKAGKPPHRKRPREEAGPNKARMRFQFLEQKYGYYHCKDCNIRWESAYVWCVQGTNKVYFRQFCRTCQKSYNPYRVENITCQTCKQTRCSCPVKVRHVDPKRPHRQDLCGRCKGKRLSCDSTFSFKYII
ncbi:zygote arrest protein 1 [Pantherophis guttatus]|uniref:Zygote arrest protein 1 n=1 Tax=Pantherophis guttatus TaxID=94885 RepID=A0ABM3ZEM6_PANGU|nr:zygote arrest protein 1 [Pantherophis guttatus]